MNIPLLPPDVRVVVVGLSPRGGRSLQACTTALRLLRSLGVETSLLSTVGLEIVPAGVENLPMPPAVQAILDSVATADAVVLGAPVHRSAVAGVSRNWVELMRNALPGKPVLPIVSAGSLRAQMVGEAFRADLWANFSATPTRAVLVTPDLDQEQLVVRLGDAALELLDFLVTSVPTSVGALA